MKETKENKPSGGAISQDNPPLDNNPSEPASPEILDMKKLSERLDKATSYIRKEVGAVAKSFCHIGHKLWEVRENKLYLGQG